MESPGMEAQLIHRLEFPCCDTQWTIAVSVGDPSAVQAAVAEVFRLEGVLNAFSPGSKVAYLNRTGEVTDADVADVVRAGLRMRQRTGGVFDITQGRLEHAVKRYIRGQAATVAPSFGPNDVTVDGDTVRATAPVDLNGIAKGWMVDRALDTLHRAGADGFVDGGGDIAHPTGPVAIEGPTGGTVAILDTRWNIATSGNSRRRRGAIDHLYDPRNGRVGASQAQVTVVSEASCAEADALATVLCVLPPRQALETATRWPGAEALFIRGGEVWWTPGFEDHVA